MELSSEKYVVVLVFEHVMSNECYHNFFVLLISFFLNFNFDFQKTMVRTTRDFDQLFRSFRHCLCYPGHLPCHQSGLQTSSRS